MHSSVDRLRVRLRAPPHCLLSSSPSFTLPLSAPLSSLHEEIGRHIAPPHSLKEFEVLSAGDALSLRPQVVPLHLHQPLSAYFSAGHSIVTLQRALVTPLTLHLCPDDNSCLFHACAFALALTSSPRSAVKWRQDVVDVLEDAILSSTNSNNSSDTTTTRTRTGTSDHYLSEFLPAIDNKERYVREMRHSAWGGALELRIISESARVRIVAIDVESLTPITFMPTTVAENSEIETCFVCFNGIHYDALYCQETHRRTFGSREQERALQRALKAADLLQKQHAYTNINTFILRCSQCQATLKGEKEANAHAQQTKHTAFEEYRS